MKVIGKVPRRYTGDELIVQMTRDEWGKIVRGDAYFRGEVEVGSAADVDRLFERQASLDRNRDRINDAVKKLQEVIESVGEIKDVVTLPKEGEGDAAS